MSLASLRTRLRAAIDHNPQLGSWKDRETNELNDAYIEICTSAQWLFLQTDAQFSTYAAIVGSSSALASVTNGSYAVTFTGATLSSTVEGHTFIAPDGLSYEIARYSSVGAETIFLMTPYAGTTTSASSSWAIRFLAYALPVDCEEPMEFIDLVTNLPLPFITRPQDTRRAFIRTNAGLPYFAVDALWKTDRPPDFAPTLAVVGTGDNALAASTKYEVCYTFTMAGRESPPSPIATATTTAGNKTITVSGMENTVDGALNTGWYKNVYIRNATRNGRWLKYATGTIDETTTTATLDNQTDISTKDFNELRPQEPLRQYVRMDPPASSERLYQVRYTKRVRPMVADNDVPLIPPPFDNLIFYTAVRRMCLSIGADGLWEKWKIEAGDMARRMAARHLDRANVIHRRESMTAQIVNNGQIPPWLLGLTASYSG